MTRRDFLIGSAAMLIAARCKADPAPPPVRGLWRDDKGALGIGGFPEFGAGPFAFDYAGLRVGPLRAATGSGWEMSGALDGSAPAAETLQFGQRTLQLANRRLAPVEIGRKGFSARSGEAKISAELASVRGQRTRGTILLIYGSGPAPKEAFDPWALWFLGEGFAVLSYDKRGCGQSGGDWRMTSLEELARDAAAVLSEARAGGLPGPVFAWGASQAGWIEPQLGAVGVVDGIILHAGPAMRPAEQIIAQVEYELKAFGFEPAEIERAKAYYALDTDVSRGRRPWSEIDAAYRAATAAKVEWILSPPPAADAPERTMIKRMADFDPAPFWQANRAATLALYGTKDWVVPAEANLPLLEKVASGQSALTTQVIQDANHLMFVASRGTRDEYPKLSRLVSAYWTSMKAWLEPRA